MRIPKALAVLLVAATLASAAAGLLSHAAPEPRLAARTLRTVVLFPAGTILRVTNFSALARFPVDPPGAQLVGAFHADHSLWIMAWTNGTPMPMCPIAMGYVGSPMDAAYNESLSPETYTLSEVCGGLGNLTVTQTIELVYGSGGAGSSTGGDGGGGAGVGSAGGVSLASMARSPLLVPALVASLLLAAGIVVLLQRRPPKRPTVLVTDAGR